MARDLSSPVEIEVTELAPREFSLVVVFDGQRFECGRYIGRTAAMQAGRLFAERKSGEKAAGRKHPRRKGA